jgi:hypothetical protein
MARASKESEGYSWTNRSIGGSNGRHGRPAGACCIRGVGVRDEGIPRARERQNPGRAPRAWGRALVRRGASTWASLGLSITGIITLLLVPACFLAGLEVASCGARQYADLGGVGAGQASGCIRVSQKKYPFSYHKSPTIVVMISR